MGRGERRFEECVDKAAIIRELDAGGGVRKRMYITPKIASTHKGRFGVLTEEQKRQRCKEANQRESERWAPPC